jgi:hypothetical protein
VLRHLGFGDQEVMNLLAQDNYSKLFKPFLSDSHISALAAIFGWSVGKEGGCVLLLSCNRAGSLIDFLCFLNESFIYFNLECSRPQSEGS